MNFKSNKMKLLNNKYQKIIRLINKIKILIFKMISK